MRSPCALVIVRQRSDKTSCCGEEHRIPLVGVPLTGTENNRARGRFLEPALGCLKKLAEWEMPAKPPHYVRLPLNEESREKLNSRLRRNELRCLAQHLVDVIADPVSRLLDRLFGLVPVLIRWHNVKPVPAPASLASLTTPHPVQFGCRAGSASPRSAEAMTPPRPRRDQTPLLLGQRGVIPSRSLVDSWGGFPGGH